MINDVLPQAMHSNAGTRALALSERIVFDNTEFVTVIWSCWYSAHAKFMPYPRNIGPWKSPSASV